MFLLEDPKKKQTWVPEMRRTLQEEREFLEERTWKWGAANPRPRCRKGGGRAETQVRAGELRGGSWGLGGGVGKKRGAVASGRGVFSKGEAAAGVQRGPEPLGRQTVRA